MPPNSALVDFPSPDQSRQVIAAWDRLLRDNDLPANLVRNMIGTKPGTDLFSLQTNLDTPEYTHIENKSVPVSQIATGSLIPRKVIHSEKAN